MLADSTHQTNAQAKDYALMTWPMGRAWAHVLLEGDAEQSVDNLVRALVAAVLGTGVAAA